jgi:uracil-DNA glycosylase
VPTLDEILQDTAAYVSWKLEDGETTAEVSREVLDALRVATVVRDKVSVAQVDIMPAAPVQPEILAVPRVEKEIVTPVARVDSSSSIAQGDNGMQDLVRSIAACKACALHKDRKQAVPGQGNLHPEILFVGEAPGADEDEQGLAFVGRAGQLLTKMIEAMGFSREEVFIANVNKCRPPNNRKPLREEMDACLPFLRQQVAMLRPKVIVALGATAVEGLVPESVEQKISSLRGNWLSFEGIPLMPTYHPAYLLRNPSMKKPVWEDLQKVLHRLGRSVPKRSSTG